MTEVLKLADTFPHDSTERKLLHYLCSHCYGWHNAKPLPVLGKLFGVSAHWIQTHVIAPSRKCSAFLATCNKGLFIIRTTADADRMLDFYDERIKAETTNREHLFSLVV